MIKKCGAIRWIKFLVTGSVISGAFSPAFANLQVFPTRLFLSPRTRVSQLTVRHTGPKPETYRISAIFYRQTADGKMEKVQNPTDQERAFTKYVRFSPREVTLPPNVEQTVKVMALPNEAMQDAEYRAHLLFEPIGQDDQKAKDGGKEVEMKLSARIAVAVPVFYKQGSPTLTVALNDLKVVTQEDKKNAFQVELQEEGKRFLYGDVKVWFTPEGGKTTQVATVLGISSYVPKRTIQYPLTLPEGLQLKKGRLKLDLNETQEEGGKLLASTELVLP